MREPRRLLMVGGIGVVVLYLLWTAKHIGADIDQTFDQQYFLNNLHGFVEFTRWPVGNPSPADATVEASYGNTFQMIAFLVSWMLSSIWNEPFDPFSASTMTDKNVMVVLVSLLAFWAVYHATRSLTASRRTAVVATVLLALIPVFTGHALMNPKDVPLAVGLTALTAGTIAAVGRLQRRSTMREHHLIERFGSRWSIGTLLALGVAFTVGTRPAAVVVVFVDIVILVTAVVVTRAHRSWSEQQPIVTGIVIGTIAVLATNSAAWPNPISWLIDSIEVSQSFPNWRGKVLVDGVYHNYDAQPHWYLPYMLFVQTPVIIGVLAILGVWFLATRLATTSRRLPKLLLWAPLPVQLLVLPLGGVLSSSLFYNAARQALFVLPILAILAAIGVAALERLVVGRRARIAVACVVGAGALLPLVDTVTLFPYHYVYYNELQRTADLTDRFEFDYWGISGRETQEWVNEHYPTSVVVYPTLWQFPPFGIDTITFARDWSNAGDREKILATNYYPSWEFDQYFDCPVVHTVTRQLWASEILLGYVRRCTGIR